MSGGFTLSGGEPLMQDRFAVRLFTGAKAMGIHTALDTNGHLGDRLSNEELDLIDVVLLISKRGILLLHVRLTGEEVGPTLILPVVLRNANGRSGYVMCWCLG